MEDRPMARKLTDRAKLDAVLALVNEKGEVVIDAGSFDDPASAPPAPPAKARRGRAELHDWARIDDLISFLVSEHDSSAANPVILREWVNATVARIQKWCEKEWGIAPHAKTIKRRMRLLPPK
jgi:hypothetical protein